MIRKYYVPVVVAFALLAAACTKTETKTAASPVDNVAVVDGKPISRNTFNQYAKGVAGKPAEDLTAEQRNELLDNLIRGEVVAQDAEKTGLAADKDTVSIMELSRLNVLQQAVAQNYLKDRKPSEEELRAEYQLQVAGLEQQYRAGHIQVATEKEAQDILADLGKGASFEKLAAEKSLDKSSASRGGALDWFAPGSMPPAFADAVRKLAKGETVKAPVQTQFGWHIIRVTDTRASAPPAYEQVKDRLAQLVEQKKFKAYTDSLMGKSKVTKTL